MTELYPEKTLQILNNYHEKSLSQRQTAAARSGKKKRKKGRHKAEGDSACRRGLPLAHELEFCM